MRVYLIGEIKKIREGKGFSRKKLANKINYLYKRDLKKKTISTKTISVKTISTKTIQRAEEGEPIKKEKASYIAKALDINLEDITCEKRKDTNDKSDILHLEKSMGKESDFEIGNEKVNEAKQLEFEFSNNEKLVILIDKNNRIAKIISTIKQDINDIQCLCRVNILRDKPDMAM